MSSTSIVVALDTNLLVYAEGVNDASRWIRVVDFLDALPQSNVRVPTQALGELYTVLTRKYRFPLDLASKRVVAWSERYSTYAATTETFAAALDLATEHNLQFWDALILATAADARCRLLLSEDLQDGFVFRGVTVANPFLDTLHPLLKDALRG